MSNLFDSRGLETLFLVLSSSRDNLSSEFSLSRGSSIIGESVSRFHVASTCDVDVCACVRVCVYTHTRARQRWAPSGRARVIPLEFLEKRRPFATEIGESMIDGISQRNTKKFGWTNLLSNRWRGRKSPGSHGSMDLGKLDIEMYEI